MTRNLDKRLAKAFEAFIDHARLADDGEFTVDELADVAVKVFEDIKGVWVLTWSGEATYIDKVFLTEIEALRASLHSNNPSANVIFMKFGQNLEDAIAEAMVKGKNKNN